MNFRRRLASQSSLLFAARVAGAGIIFVVQAAIARLWGAHILGEFMLVMAVMSLIMAFLPLGFQTISTYFVAEYRAKNDGLMLRKFLFRAYSHVLIMGGLVIILIVPSANMFGEIGQLVKEYWLQITIIAIAIAIFYVNGATLVGLKRPFLGFLADALFRPVLVLLSFVFAAFLFAEPALVTMMSFMSVGFVIIAIGQFFIVLKTIKQIPDMVEKRPAETKRWWRFATPWVLIAMATDFFFEINLIILSSYLEPSELAVFGVIGRIFMLVSFGVAAVYAVTLPDMFESEANDDREGFLHKIGEANLVATALAFVLVVGVAIGGQFILQVFGAEFISGACPLVILCGALLVRSIFGPASLVLSIHDKPFASLPAVALGLVSLVVLNYLLVPSYGLNGAAWAALGSITIWSIALWFTALKFAKVDVSIYSALKRNLSFSTKP